jgi:hypothetical protein
MRNTTDRFTALDRQKLGYGGLVLGSSHYLILPKWPHKIMLATKVLKTTQKIPIC